MKSYNLSKMGIMLFTLAFLLTLYFISNEENKYTNEEKIWLFTFCSLLIIGVIISSVCLFNCNPPPLKEKIHFNSPTSPEAESLTFFEGEKISTF